MEKFVNFPQDETMTFKRNSKWEIFVCCVIEPAGSPPPTNLHDSQGSASAGWNPVVM